MPGKIRDGNLRPKDLERPWRSIENVRTPPRVGMCPGAANPNQIPYRSMESGSGNHKRTYRIGQQLDLYTGPPGPHTVDTHPGAVFRFRVTIQKAGRRC